jgi:hypothetical protein
MFRRDPIFHFCLSNSGSVHAWNTRSGGASMMRVMISSRSGDEVVGFVLVAVTLVLLSVLMVLFSGLVLVHCDVSTVLAFSGASALPDLLMAASTLTTDASECESSAAPAARTKTA